MAFYFQKISDYGTSSPFVTRTSFQANRLMEPFPFEKKRKEEIFGILHSKVLPHLVACAGIVESIADDVGKIREEVKKEGIEMQSQGRVVTVPSVMNLEAKVETYLYNAKLVLRDITGLFLPFWGKQFNHSRYDKILKWSEERFGDKHELTQMLRSDQNWIKRVVTMRNAVEHPGTPDTLNVKNFQVKKFGNSIVLTEPTWWLNQEKPVPIIKEMDILIWNMLGFQEDLLVIFLQTIDVKMPFAFSFVEIPESKRDPQCPMRLQIVWNTSNRGDNHN